MNYYINGQEVNEKKFFGRLEFEVIEQSEYEFDVYLDEIYGEVKIGGFVFDSSRVLFTLDEIAYNSMYQEFVDYFLEERKYDLDRGEEVVINKVSFSIVE